MTACFFGEGAAAEGEFHESLNLAALWKLPVLFLCENNLYAMGTALARSNQKPICASRREAIGCSRKRWTAWTCLPSRLRPRAAAAAVRRGDGPYLPRAEDLSLSRTFDGRPRVCIALRKRSTEWKTRDPSRTSPHAWNTKTARRHRPRRDREGRMERNRLGSGRGRERPVGGSRGSRRRMSIPWRAMKPLIVFYRAVRLRSRWPIMRSMPRAVAGSSRRSRTHWLKAMTKTTFREAIRAGLREALAPTRASF